MRRGEKRRKAMGDRNAGGRPETRNRMGGSDAKYRKRGKKGFVVVVYLLSVCLFCLIFWDVGHVICFCVCILVFLYSCILVFLGTSAKRPRRSVVTPEVIPLQ